MPGHGSQRQKAACPAWHETKERMRRFHRAASFETAEQGGRQYLRHVSSGDMVPVDDAPQRLWRAVGGQSVGELCVQVGAELGFTQAPLEAVLGALASTGLMVTDELP